MRKTFALLPRIEAIRILVAFAAHMEIKLYQMDVKSAFLNEYLKEEVYIKQLPGFENHDFSNHVFKLDKAPVSYTHLTLPTKRIV